ncbi:zinc finger, CCHC-type, retrotransposon gag domain protein, partial [Tanacetum coccineum]
KKDRAAYWEFSACAPPQFVGSQNPLVSMRWITDIMDDFRTSRKGIRWLEACSYKQFKEMVNVEYAPVKEIGKTKEEFHSLVQTHDSVNEICRRFCDMVQCCSEYLNDEKLGVDKFQINFKEMREIVSPVKCKMME